MIDSRVDDGRGDTSIVYTMAPAAGIWQPPATGMALRLARLRRPGHRRHAGALDGPDSLTSAAYTADYNEVQRARLRRFHRAHGRADRRSRGSSRTTRCDVPRRPVPLPRRGAARPHPAHPHVREDRRCGRDVASSRPGGSKYDVGFWRPFQAIQLAGDDRNPDTVSRGRLDAARRRSRPTPTTPAVTPAPRRRSPRSSARRSATTCPSSSAPQDVPDRSVRDADRPRARRAQRPHLGWPALPRRHGRRLPPRPHDGGPGDATRFADSTGAHRGVVSDPRPHPLGGTPGRPAHLGWGCCRAACPTGRSP